MLPLSLFALSIALGASPALRVLLRRVDAFEWPRLDCLIANVQRHQLLAPTGPFPKVGIERNAREFSLEVLRVFLAIDRIMQHAVDVIEDCVLWDRALGFVSSFVVRTELLKSPVGDIVECLPGGIAHAT